MHGDCEPSITQDVNGGVVVGVFAMVLAFPAPQPFEAVTETSPAVLPAVTVIEVVPCPETMVQPVGKVQL